VERVHVKLAFTSFEVDEREGLQSLIVPLIKSPIHPTALTVAGEITMRRRKEVGCHSFDLRRKDVPQASRKGLRVITFTTESERTRQPRVGKQIAGTIHEFRQALVSKVYCDNMGQSNDPNLRMIEPLFDAFGLIDVEKLRMQRTLEK